MQKLELTTFQIQCRDRVISLLNHAALFVHFAHIRAAEDVLYLVARVDTTSHHLQIYIYEDDAGFYADDQWIQFEHQDFKEPAQLIDALCNTLKNYL